MIAILDIIDAVIIAVILFIIGYSIVTGTSSGDRVSKKWWWILTIGSILISCLICVTTGMWQKPIF